MYIPLAGGVNAPTSDSDRHYPGSVWQRRGILKLADRKSPVGQSVRDWAPCAPFFRYCYVPSCHRSMSPAASYCQVHDNASC